MFEARLIQGSVLKKIIDAIKDIVTEINLDCSSTGEREREEEKPLITPHFLPSPSLSLPSLSSPSGISVQAMDNSHVCLVLIELGSDGFEPYRCDRNITLGLALKT